MEKLKQWLWPFDGNFLEVEQLPEHLKEQARMRNRWRLDALRPYILRWVGIVGFLGLSLYIVGYMPDSGLSLFLHTVVFTAWFASVCITGGLVWLYSKRPK